MNNKHIEELLDQALKEYEELEEKINNAINYIKWHYDLGTKDNLEFCFLRDRLLEILEGDKENE